MFGFGKCGCQLFWGCFGSRDALFDENFFDQAIRVTAQQDVRTTTSHIGSNSDGAFATGLGDDVCFAFVLLGIEYVVDYAGFFEEHA